MHPQEQMKAVHVKPSSARNKIWPPFATTCTDLNEIKGGNKLHHRLYSERAKEAEPTSFMHPQ